MESRKALIAIAILGALFAMAIALFLGSGGGGPSPNITGSARKITLLISLAALGVLAVVVLIFYTHGASKKRKARWLEKADAIGDAVNLEFEENVPKNFHRDFTFLPEINKSGKTNRLAYGEIADRNALFFERSYVVNSGQTTITVYHCVYATDAPNWPNLSVTPRSGFSKLLRSFGRRSGMLLDDPEFNHAFVVRCDDEPFAVTLLTPEMQHFMLGKTNTRWRITNGKVFLVYKGALKLDRMPISVDRLARFWSFVPPEVGSWERRGVV